MKKKLLCMLLSLLLALGSMPALATGIVLGDTAPAEEEPVAPAADAASDAPEAPAFVGAAGAAIPVAPAENGDVLLPGAASPVSAGGALYFTSGKTVYAYAPHATQAEPLCELPSDFIQLLGGDALWGLDMITGEAGPIKDGTLDVQAKLDWSAMVVGGQLQYMVYGMCRTPDAIYMLAYENSNLIGGAEQLLRFDLATGEMTANKMTYALAIAPYKDGKVMLLWQNIQRLSDSGGTDLGIMVDEVDAEGALGDTVVSGLGQQMGGMAYDASSDTVYLSGAGEVKRVAADGTLETVAYAPVANSMTQPAVMVDGFYAVQADDGVLLRALGETQDGEKLTILGGTMDDTARAFMQDTGIALSFDSSQMLTGSEAVRNDMLSGASNVDIYVLNMLLGVDTLMDKGYLAPIESEALLSDVQSMYPQIAEALMRNGKLYAYPQQFQLISWAINEDAWAQVGWDEEAPTTFGELFAQLDLWNREYAEKFPDYNYMQLYLGGVQLLSNALTQYALMYAKPDEALKFDSQAFIDVLAQIENMDIDMNYTEEITPELMEEITAVLMRESLVESLTTDVLTVVADAEPKKRPIPPMVFTEGETPAIQASMTVYVLNPNSPNLDLATQFLEYAAAHPSDRLRVSLHPDEDTPARPKDYEKTVADVQKEIDALSAQIDTAEDADKADLTAKIDQYNAQLENLEQSYWAVSPDGVSYYRELAPYMTLGLNAAFMFNMENAAANEELNTLLIRYMDGQLNADQLVKELDKKLEMMYLETN